MYYVKLQPFWLSKISAVSRPVLVECYHTQTHDYLWLKVSSKDVILLNKNLNVSGVILMKKFSFSTH